MMDAVKTLHYPSRDDKARENHHARCPQVQFPTVAGFGAKPVGGERSVDDELKLFVPLGTATLTFQVAPRPAA
jgi:hypothetical protein